MAKHKQYLIGIEDSAQILTFCTAIC